MLPSIRNMDLIVKKAIAVGHLQIVSAVNQKKVAPLNNKIY